MTAAAVAAPSGSLLGGGTTGLHTLYSQGPFTVVGQCIVGANGGNNVFAQTYLVSSETHGLDGLLSGFETGDRTGVNSTTTPVAVADAVGINGGTSAAPSGTTSTSFTGMDDDGYFNAVSSDLKTSLDAIVSNGINVGGNTASPTTDCVFEGSIHHT